MDMKNDHPSEGIPPILYHYTSQEGLLGIIKNRKIWATNIFYLNDATEYTYATGLIIEVLKKYRDELLKNSIPVDERSKSLLQAYLGAINNSDETYPSFEDKLDEYQYYFIQVMIQGLSALEINNVYVCSFSENDDQLSQWRGYCPPSSGFCLGFKTSELKDKIREQDFQLVKCIYEKENQEIRIRKIIDDSILDLKNKLDSMDDKDGDKYLKGYLTAKIMRFIDIIPCLKHEKFREEAEWRVQCILPNSAIQFRRGASMVMPYIEIPLAFEGEELLVMESVTIGPTPHGKLSQKSIASFLESQKLKGCKIDISKAPYRTW